MTNARRAAISLLLATAVLAGACGLGTVETSEAPGFSGTSVPVDRSEFVLPGANRDGSPTTMGSEPTLSIPGETTTTSEPPPTTSTTSTTTTTLPDTRPVVRRSGEITDLCGLSRAIRSSGTLLDDPTLDVVATHNEIKASMDSYVAVAPQDWLERVSLVRDVIFRIADRVAAANYDIDDPGSRELISDVINGRGEYARFLTVVSEIDQLERFACS